MVFELLATLLIEVLVPQPSYGGREGEHEEVWCDDGSSAWISTEQPNWACTIDGCSPQEKVCWGDRLVHCFDADGKDLKTCAYGREHCHSQLECFDLWLYCPGKYECLEPEIIGCSYGICTTATERRTDSPVSSTYRAG